MNFLFFRKISTLAIAPILLSSCIFHEEQYSGKIGKEQMIIISHDRNCMKFFQGTTTFDGCIFRIQPYFDQLTLEEKREVSINFIVYGNLQLGSATAFAMLIDPFRLDILNFLEEVSNSELRSQYRLGKKGISKYRKRVKRLREHSIPR